VGCTGNLGGTEGAQINYSKQTDGGNGGEGTGWGAGIATNFRRMIGFGSEGKIHLQKPKKEGDTSRRILHAMRWTEIKVFPELKKKGSAATFHEQPNGNKKVRVKEKGRGMERKKERFQDEIRIIVDQPAGASSQIGE